MSWAVAELESGLTDLSQQFQELSSPIGHLVAGQDWQEFKTVADLVEARKVLSATIRRTIDREPDLVISGTYYLSIAFHMERTADYLTNICERMAYIMASSQFFSARKTVKTTRCTGGFDWNRSVGGEGVG